MDNPQKIFLSLGSNIGDRHNHLETAIKLLSERLGELITLSSVHETEPWGYLEQDLFLNQCAVFSTYFSPEECMDIILQIESDMGRQRLFKNSPRTIDIDILYYEWLIVSSPTLTIPHPFIPERLFVLNPLTEIAPDFIHPQLQKTNRELLDRLLLKNKGV